MPGFTTHYLFGQQAYQHLPANDLKYTIQKYHQVFSLGLQGPDIFFYSCLPFFSKTKNPGSIAHTTNTGDFLEQLLKCPVYFPSLAEQKIAQTYALGFVGHYLLDTACHPYIYARSASYEKKKGSLSRHLFLETDIDSVLLWHFSHKKPSEFRQNTTITLSKEQMKVVSTLLYLAFKKTYPSLGITKAQISHAIISMQKGTRMLYDASGYKKAFVRRIESIFPGYPVLSPLIANDTLQFFKDPCNTRHQIWCNPWDSSQTSNAGFFELFHDALTEYQTFMQDIAVCFTTEGSLKQKDDAVTYAMFSLGSKSYHSGLPSASHLL